MTTHVEDLHWYYGQMARDLGESSSFPAMVATIECGGPQTYGYPTQPWPDERRTNAAKRSTRIMRTLRLVPPHLRAVIECAYEPKRRSAQDKALFGELTVGVVERASSVVRGLLHRDEYRAASAIQGCVMALSGTKRRPPEWSPWISESAHADMLSGKQRSDRIRGEAEALLERAHAAYRDAKRRLREQPGHLAGWNGGRVVDPHGRAPIPVVEMN